MNSYIYYFECIYLYINSFTGPFICAFGGFSPSYCHFSSVDGDVSIFW